MTATKPLTAKSNDGSGPRRVLRLIEALCRSDEPTRLADLAATAALSKPTAHRLLSVLIADGWAVAHEGGRYGIGPTARAVAAMVIRAGREDSVESVLVELQQKVGQTVHLGMRSGDRIVYTHKVEGTQPFAMASRVGTEQPLHSTGIGKCILAGLDEPALAEFVERAGLARRTERTITTSDALTRELATVRARGYALDEEENEANIRCVAAPIHAADGRTIGAVSVSTVTFVVAREELLALRDDVLETAKRLEATLG
ncbi:IclR family transcriptional regulator [Saccharopolyspora sp. K220]|uniref:IclR family transcriptional regulator n=1 Tax=Saccharopolyspora soli TaxID=2926618 RepID=UPI001F59E030|nr:IclR family transcriptional regulator [Saccharopolyspora soli]MCI2422453.1 IclR family transcriptional regulator [Saccharopolyspora soli]